MLKQEVEWRSIKMEVAVAPLKLSGSQQPVPGPGYKGYPMQREYDSHVYTHMNSHHEFTAI